MTRPAFAAFVRLSRLRFLLGGFAGCAFGGAIAAYDRAGTIDWKAYVIAQTSVTALQLMTHYSNDYFDRAGDALGRPTPFAGGSGVLVDGLLAPPIALRAALICLALGLAAALALAVIGARLSAALALAIALLAWAYSAPPLRLLARGLGELDTALVVGVLVPLAAFCAQGLIPGTRTLVSVCATGGAMLVMMLCVEIPDFEADNAAGKRNLLVRFGARALGPFAGAALLATYASIALARLLGAPGTFALFEFGTLLAALPLVRHLRGAFGSRAAGMRAAQLGVAYSAYVNILGALGYSWAALGWRI